MINQHSAIVNLRLEHVNNDSNGTVSEMLIEANQDNMIYAEFHQFLRMTVNWAELLHQPAVWLCLFAWLS